MFRDNKGMEYITITHELSHKLSNPDYKKYRFTPDGRCFDTKKNKEMPKRYYKGGVGFILCGRFFTNDQIEGMKVEV